VTDPCHEYAAPRASSRRAGDRPARALARDRPPDPRFPEGAPRL